jgi:hypothetical protein
MRFVASVVIQPKGDGVKQIKEEAGHAATKLGVAGEAAEKLTGKVSELARLAGPAAGELAEKIEGVAKSFTGVVEVVGSLGPLLPIVLALAGAVALLGAAFKAGEFLVDAVKEASEAQVILRSLEQTLTATGAAARYSAKELQEHAEALSTITAFDDDVIIQAETILARFTKIGHEAFPVATTAVLDYAQATGKSAPEAAEKLGKALESPQKGLRGIADAGVIFNKVQVATLQKMVDTGHAAEAQGIILTALQERVGGAAEAYQKTLKGGVDTAINRFHDFGKTIGGEIIPALDFLMQDIVQSLGGWEQMNRVVQRVAKDIGRFIAEMVYGVLISYHEWQANQQLAIANLSDGLKGFVDFGFEVAAQLVTAFAKVPSILGGGSATWGPVLSGIRSVQTAAIAGLNATAQSARASAVEQIKAYDAAGQALLRHKSALEGDSRVAAALARVNDDDAAAAKKAASAIAQLAAVAEKAVAAAQLELRNAEAQLHARTLGTDALKAEIVVQGALAKARAAGAGATSAQRLEIIRSAVSVAQNNAAIEAWNANQAEIDRLLVKTEKDMDDLVASLGRGVDKEKEATAAWDAFKASLAEQVTVGEAEFTDWREQTEATHRYGAAVADVLARHGLLSKASRELNILAEIRLGLERLGVKETDKDYAKKMALVELEVRGNAAKLDAIHAQQAAAELAQRSAEELRGIWISLGDSIRNTILDNVAAAAAGSKVEWGDMWKSFLQQGIRAGLEWLQQWLRNIAVAKAAEAGLGTGGGASNYGAASAASSAAGSAGGGISASSAGTAAGYAIIFAIWAKVVTGLWEGFTRKRVQYGEASIGEGGLVRESGNSRLAGQAAEAIRDLVKQVNSLAQEWHLGLVKLTAGSVSIGKNSAGEFIVKTLVDGYGKVFHSLEEAQEYAKVQALKFADLSNVTDAIVRTAIQNSRAVDTAGLQRDVEFAQRITTDGLDDVTKQMRGFLDTFVADWKHAFELFGQIGFRGAGDLSQLGPATSAILLNFTNSLQGLYDSLTGHKQDAKELAEAQRVAFNAQRAIMIAQITLLIAEVQARIADYQTMLLVGYGRGGGGSGPGNGGHGQPSPSAPLSPAHHPYGKGGSSGPSGKPLGAPQGPDVRNPTGDANMAALLAVLDALMAALLHIPGEIPKGGVKIPHGGGGANRQETHQNALDHLDELRNANLSDAMRIYRDSEKALADWRKEAKEGRLTQAQLAEGERLIAEQRKKELRSQAESLAGIGTDFTRQLREGMTFFADLKKLGRKETGIPDWLRNVMEGKFLDKMKASWSQGVMQLAGISDPFAQINAQTAELRENLVALAKASGMSAAEVLAASAALDHAAGMAKRGATYQLEDRLFEPLKDLPQWQGKIVELKKDEVNLQYEILKAQLIAAGLWEKDKDVWQASHDASIAALGAAEAIDRAGQRWSGAGWVDAADSLASAQSDAARAFTDLVRNLVDSNRRILTGAQSPLGPQERFQTALADYQRTLTAAQGGNSEALGALPGIRDALLSVAQTYFAGGAGEGLSGGFAQLVQQTLADFANLAVSPAVEAATLQDLVRRQSTIATDAAAQAHADLISLRQAVIDLNANNGVGNLYGGSNRFASAPAAPVDRFSSGAPVAPVVPFPVRGGGDGGESAMAAEIRLLRAQVTNLERLALRTANATEGIEENTESMAESEREHAMKARRTR